MRKSLFPIFSLILLLGPASMQAQSLVSGFMNGKGKGSVALSYAYEQYDKVLLAPNDADGVPVFNEVTLTSASIYGAYGLTNRLDVVMSLPHIKAEGDADPTVLNELGFENSRSGLQDLSLYLRYNPYSLELGENQLDFILAAGLKTPLGDYRVDEGLQSIVAIGNRATSVNGIGMAQFRTPSGFFAGAQAGYSFRSDEVPNALLGEIKLGYAGRGIYVDAWYAGQVSDGGVNILGEGFVGFFPATDVTYTRAGVTVYVPVAAGFGVSGGAGRYLSGRNIGQATHFFGSLSYSF